MSWSRTGDPSWARIAEAARLVCQTQVGAVTLLEDGRPSLQATAGWQHSNSPAVHAFGRLAIAAQETIVVPDVSTHAELRSDPLAQPPSSWCCYAGAPITEPEGPVSGEVWVANDRPRQLTRRQLNVLEELAGTAAGLLRQREVQHQLWDTLVGAQRDRALLSLHSSVLAAVARGIPVHDTLERLATRVEWLLGRGYCAIVRVDPGEQHIRHVAAPTLPPDFRDSLLGLPIGRLDAPAADGSLDSGGCWVGDRRRAAADGLSACWAIPIRGEHDLMLGALAVYQTSAGEPSPEQTQLLRRLVALGRLAIEQEHARERLVYLSSHDELTGLLNRGSFFTRCAEVLRDVDAGHTTAAVVFVDVDGFKPLNDRYGHGVGDQLLRVTARRLQSAVRPHDVVSRFGGDEFVLLCQGLAEEAQVVMLAERVLAELGAPIIAAGAKLKVTVSAGAAIAYAGTVRGVEELLSSADAAMYQAKRLGGNQVVVANEPLE